MEYDIEKLKKELKEELKEEMMNELKLKDTIYVRRQVSTVKIRKEYHDKIYKKFGSTGTIEDAIRTVATYSMGYRKVASIPFAKEEEFENKLKRLYEFVLNEENKI